MPKQHRLPVRVLCENHDVADKHRDRLIELIGQWYVEAGKYNVLPVDGRGQQRFAEPRPEIAKDRSRYVFYPGTSEVAASAAPKTLNRPHTITAFVDIPDDGAEGVIVSQGGIDGGVSLYVQDGRLHYAYNYVADQHFDIASDTQVPSGQHALSMEFEPTGEAQPRQGRGTPGTVTLFVDGEPVGRGRATGHDPDPAGSRIRRRGRRRQRLSRHRRLHAAVPVHRHDRPGRLRRLRRARRRPRSRDQSRARPPVAHPSRPIGLVPVRSRRSSPAGLPRSNRRLDRRS